MTKAKPVKKGKKLGNVKPLTRAAVPSIKPLMSIR
jgi:hypothetical protein